MKNILSDICSSIIESKELLNEMDSELGDGDTGKKNFNLLIFFLKKKFSTGSTLTRGAEGIIKEVSKLNLVNPHAMLTALSDTLMVSMGGTAGAIFSIFLQCSSNAFIDNNENSVANWTRALSIGIKGIMEHGRAEIGDRTLVDSLNSGNEAMKEIKSGKVFETVKAFAEGCTKGAEATRNMRPKSGRASYSVGDFEEFHSKYPDPGAYAISLIANAILKNFEC